MPGLVNDLRRLGETPDPGPFSHAVCDAHSEAGAEWEARQAVRKALSRVKAADPGGALAVLDAAAARLPEGPTRSAVTAFAERLRGTIEGGEPGAEAAQPRG